MTDANPGTSQKRKFLADGCAECKGEASLVMCSECAVTLCSSCFVKSPHKTHPNQPLKKGKSSHPLRSLLRATLPDLGVIADIADIVFEYALPGPPPFITPPSNDALLPCGGRLVSTLYMLCSGQVAASSKMVFIADASSSVVLCFDMEGQFIRYIAYTTHGGTNPAAPCGIVIFNDSLFVSYPSQNQVVSYTLDGVRQTQWEVPYASLLAVGDGMLFVTSIAGVYACYPDGNIAKSFILENEFVLIFEGMAYGNGLLYLTTPSSHHVSVFDTDGHLQRHMGFGPLPELTPESITIDQGFMFISDKLTDSIAVFSLEGVFINRFGTRGRGEGQFSEPLSVAFAEGWAFISEGGNRRIQTLDRRVLQPNYEPSF